MKKVIMISTLALLSACGSKPDAVEETVETDTEVSQSVADPNAPPAAFAQCAACHKVEAGAPNGLGPNLHGVVGQKAALVAGFNYSPAMKASGLTWDEATLDQYITNPRALVVGTKMSFAGQPDAAKRAEIIAWLKKN
ncbi:MAG: cytochrome c family protein [Chakrabartia sp.]